MGNFGKKDGQGGEGFGSYGYGQKDCHYFVRMTINLTLTASPSTGKMQNGIWKAKRVKSGKCENTTFKCAKDNHKLGVGEQSSVVELDLDGKKTTIKECEQCKEEKDPLETLMESLGDKGMEVLGAFMDKACADPPSKTDIVLKIDATILCYKKIKKKGCEGGWTHQSKDGCNKTEVEKWGEGSSRMEWWGWIPTSKSEDTGMYPPDDILDVLNGTGIPLDALCEIWEELKKCIFKDDGNGPPIPDIGEKIADCIEKYLNIDYIQELAKDLDLDISNLSDEDLEILIAALVEKLKDCICLKEL